MASKLPEVVFPNGDKMPIFGLGTWQSSSDDVGKAVDTALQLGYRHIDTAFLYQNEAQIGAVLKKWLDSGKLKRKDLFIVTNLPNIGNRPERVEKYLKMSLEALQLDYVDLYLIHNPVGLSETETNGTRLLEMDTDLVAIWKAMEAQVDAGRTRSIGVSNFNSEQVKRVWKTARIKPANNQVELHVYSQQRELVAFCKALDVTVCAWGPIGSQGMYAAVQKYWGTGDKVPKQNPLTDPVVKKIADKHKKTTAQVLLRHIMQRGIAVIPKSTNPDRIKQNFDVFDFELSAEDVEALDALDKGPKGRMSNEHVAPLWAKHPEFPFKIRY